MAKRYKPEGKDNDNRCCFEWNILKEMKEDNSAEVSGVPTSERSIRCLWSVVGGSRVYTIHSVARIT